MPLKLSSFISSTIFKCVLKIYEACIVFLLEPVQTICHPLPGFYQGAGVLGTVVAL